MATYRTSVAGGGTSGTSNRTLAITPAVGDLLVVFCKVSANTNASPTCSDNNTGGTYTRVGTALHNSSGDMLSCFVRNATVPNTTSTTVTVATGSNTAGEIVIVAVAGMSKVGAAAIRSSGFQANQAAGGTPAPALNQAALTGNVTMTAVGAEGAAAANGVPNASWTERQDAAQSTPTTGLEVATRDSGFTGTTITYGGTTATAFGSAAIELNGANDGALSKTLDVVTFAATGTSPVVGTMSKTLDTVTFSGTGTAPIVGALSKTLDSVTFAATGTASDPPVVGTLSLTLDPIMFAAAGTSTVVGSASLTLDAVTFAAAGNSTITGTLSKTLDVVTFAATAASPIVGTLSTTLDAIVFTAVGAAPVVGVLSKTLNTVTFAAIGTASVLGTLSKTLDTVTFEATGSAQISTTGVLDVVLDAVAFAATGAAPVVAGLSTILGQITLTAIGTSLITGTLSTTLDPITLVATGTSLVTGSVSLTLDEIAFVAAGVAPVTGSLSLTLDEVVFTAASPHAHPPFHANIQIYVPAYCGIILARVDFATLKTNMLRCFVGDSPELTMTFSDEDGPRDPTDFTVFYRHYNADGTPGELRTHAMADCVRQSEGNFELLLMPFTQADIGRWFFRAVATGAVQAGSPDVAIIVSPSRV